MSLATITKKSDFSAMRHARPLFRGSHFILRALKSAQQEKKQENFALYGLVVSRKVGNAIVRNKVKRRLRMILREVFKDITTPLKQDRFVIYTRPSIATEEYAILKKQITLAIKPLKGDQPNAGEGT